jgi:hypothetical protein
MKASEIYRKAAEWMAEQQTARLMAFACLSVAPNDNHIERLAHMEELLGGKYVDLTCYDLNAEVLCLLLMREIAKDEQ